MAAAIAALLPLALNVTVAPGWAASPPPGESAYIPGTDPAAEARAGAERKQARALVHKAGDLLHAGDRAGAIQAYREAYSIYFGVPLDQLGDLLAEEGQLTEAIAMYRQLVYREGGHDWKDADGRSLRNVVLDATPTSSELWKADRNWGGGRGADADVLMRYALLLERAGQRDEAWQAYQWALTEGKWYNQEQNLFVLPVSPQPQAFDAPLFEAAAHAAYALTSPGWEYINDADQNYREGQKAIARAEYAKAIALKPNFAPAHYLLGNLLRAERNIAGARAEWQKAVESDRSGYGMVRKLAQAKLDNIRNSTTPTFVTPPPRSVAHNSPAN